MYTIVHLPTNTVYALNTDNRLRLVFFKKYDNARYVAESLSTHIEQYKTLPELSDQLCLQHPKNRRHSTSLDSRRINDLWVRRCELTHTTALNMGTRGLGITVVDSLDWNGSDWNPKARDLDLVADPSSVMLMMQLDNDLLLE